MNSEEWTDKLLHQTGALQQGHFMLASGRHSPIRIDRYRLLTSPPDLELLVRLLVGRLKSLGAHAVAAPATGAIVVAHEVARQLGSEVLYAERRDARSSRRVFRHGQGFFPGERVVAVDDVLDSGRRLSEVLEAVRQAGGSPVGAAAILRVGKVRSSLGLPVFTLRTVTAIDYAPAICPLCQRNQPLTTDATRAT